MKSFLIPLLASLSTIGVSEPPVEAGVEELQAALEAVSDGDFSQAAVNFDRACSAEIWVACSYLGTLKLRGIGVARDTNQARTLFDESCAAGVGASCHQLANMLYEGIGGPKDVDGAIALFQTLCDNEYEQACSSLVSIQTANEQTPPE